MRLEITLHGDGDMKTVVERTIKYPEEGYSALRSVLLTAFTEKEVNEVIPDRTLG